jgi:hypothetical protein
MAQEAFDADTGETIQISNGERTCFCCGGAGCYDCDNSGWIPLKKGGK